MFVLSDMNLYNCSASFWVLCFVLEKELRSDDFHSELPLSKPEEDESLGAAQLSEQPDQARLLLALLNLVGVGIGSGFQINGFLQKSRNTFSPE